jgi:hypothetical protein
MSEPPPLHEVVVGDRYWLGRARGMLDQSIRGRDEAAGRLASGIGWLWTVYAGAALVGSALRQAPLPGWVVALLVAPAVLLVVAYGLATWALLPVEVAFDPRVVEEIRQVHTHATRVKRQRLRVAAVAAGLGALLVVVAVVATVTVRPDEVGSGRSLAAAAEPAPSGGVVVLVGGRVPAGASVVVTVTPLPGGAPVSVLAVADTAGRVRESVRVPAAGGYEVRAAWTDRGQRWTLTTRAAGPTVPPR